VFLKTPHEKKRKTTSKIIQNVLKKRLAQVSPAIGHVADLLVDTNGTLYAFMAEQKMGF
jgi:hypothetical protein